MGENNTEVSSVGRQDAQNGIPDWAQVGMDLTISLKTFFIGHAGYKDIAAKSGTVWSVVLTATNVAFEYKLQHIQI